MTWARWGWLVTTLALGVALIATSWANYRSAVAAENTLNRGQAEILENAVRDLLRGQADVTSHELDSVIATLSDDGLRYVALIDPRSDSIVHAGEPQGELRAPVGDGAPPELVDMGERVRSHTGRVVPDGPGRRGRFQPMVLEFEPVVASDLEAEGLRSLLIGFVGAAVLSMAAILFWRLSNRYEDARRRMEQQRRLSILGEMSAVLAHEIRNPLASLKGHAQLLLERLGEDAPESRRAARVVTEATRLEALTTDLLDFARSGPLDVREIDPAALAREAAEEVGIDARIHADTAPATWPLDPQRFRQVLVNLMRNAAQVSPEHAPPEVHLAVENGELRLDVRDRGPGIEAGMEQRIFDPFFTTRTNGTGLGLAVALRIVQLHGGSIDAVSDPAGGGVFTVRIPRQPEALWRAS